MNASLIARMDSLISSTEADGAQFVSNEVQRLKAALPYQYEAKKLAEGEQPSEDHMIVSLLSQVINEAHKKEQQAAKGAEGRDARLVAELEWHKKRLLDRQVEIENEKVEIANEQKKWITSDDMHLGWDSKTVRPASSPRPCAHPRRVQLADSELPRADGLERADSSTRLGTSHCVLVQASADQDRDGRRDAQLARCAGCGAGRGASRPLAPAVAPVPSLAGATLSRS